MEKNFALSATKKKVLTLVLSQKKILNETKNHNPPSFQVKWSVPNYDNRIHSSSKVLALVTS